MPDIDFRITSADYVYLDFDYDKELVNYVKENIPGRKYVKRSKEWKFKLNRNSLPDFLKFLQDWDLDKSDVPRSIQNRMESIIKEAKKVEKQKEKNKRLAEKDEVEDFKVYGLAQGMNPYPFQEVGIKYAVENKNVIIGDEPGLGKTVESIAAMHKQDAYPVLVVCPASLKDNWKREWNMWLPRKTAKVQHSSEGLDLRARVCIINYDILWKYRKKLREHDWGGLILDESHYVKNGSAKRSKAARQIARRIDGPKVLLSGTAVVNRPKELINQLKIIDRFEEEFGGFYPFVKRYCLPENAPVLMSDFSEKDVSDISVGDKVIGWKKRESGHSQLVESKVLNTFKRKADIQKTVMENGDVLYHTPDHKWANGSKIKNGGDGPFWVEAKAERERENTWRASQLAKVYRSEKEDYFENEDYMKGYLFGAFRGDGWLSRTRHIKESPWREKKSKGDYYEHSCGIATQDREIIQRCFDYLNNLSITSNTMSQRSDGLWKIECSNKSHWNFFQNEALKRNKDKHWYAGFLAGIYDTEATGLVIAQCSEYNKSTYNLIQNALDFFEFNYNSYKEKITVTGGRTALFKLWKISNPALQRKLKRYVLNAGGRFVSSKQKVKSTEIVEKNVNVYTIKTETGNYVAYGYCSRNCDAKQTRWGLDYDGASNIKELHERLKKLCYIRRNKKEVLEDLPDKQRSYIEFDVDNRKEYNMAEEDLAAHLRKQEITDEDFLEKIENLDAFEQQEKIRKEYGANEVSGYAEKLMKLAELRKLASKGKLKKAKKWIKDFLKSGEKLVLFAHHKFVIQELVDEFNALKIDGSVPVEDRQDVVDKFQNDDSEKVIVLNIQAGGTGLTLTESSNVVFLELPWTPAEVSQAEDRCVLEGQPVLTTNGWTSIEDVNVGEHVIGHDGKPHKVTDKWSRKAKGAYSSDSKDIVEIDLLGWQNPIKVTSDHRILTENGWIEASDISPRDKILMPKQYDSPDKEAIKVSEECRLDETYKIPEQNLFGDYYETKRVKPESVQKNGNLIKLPDSLELSKDALFTFGYYIGDGHCYTGNKKGRYVSFAAHQNQKDSHLKTCRNWIESLGINSRTRNDDNSMGCEMRSYSGELAMWFENNFGRKLDQKKIPEWVYECSKKQREWFIEGWLAADGYKKRNRKEIITAKKHLAAEASRLLMSIGYKPCVNYGKDSGSYSVGWTEKVEPKLTVKSVYQRTCNKKERVYDITVKDVNSFVVGTSVVHNCHRIGQEDSVNVYFLLAKETIDKDMFEVLKKKRIVTEQINAGKDITDEEGNVVKGVIKKITDRQS